MTLMVFGSNEEAKKMKTSNGYSRFLMWFVALLLSALAAGCGGGGSEGRDPILGTGGSPGLPVVPDTTRPRVTVTVPANAAVNVFTNTAITAVFTEDMAPATITAPGTFTLTAGGIPVAGVVTYVVASRQLVFTPAAPLANTTLFTATITTAATDLAGNQLAGNVAPLPAASNFVWTFTTGLLPDVTAPTVTLTNPVDLAIGVAINTAVNATFSESMAPLTILAPGTFTLRVTGPPLGPALAGAVTYAPLTNIATFTPASNLLANTSYTATVTAAATDLAGNALVAGLVPNPWTFTTGGGLAPGAVPLGSAAGFGIMATSATTSTGATLINGDVALRPGTSQGIPPVQVNGTIHVNDAVAALAQTDLLTAYNFAKALAPGVGPNVIAGGADLGALFPLPGGIPPGTYTSGSTMLVSTPLTLNAGGNANAVWVFQIGSSLTTGASVLLANGAQAKNVFWVPTAAATIGVGTTFEGTILAGGNVTGVTGAIINGRILAGAIGAATVALDANVVNVPAP